MPARASIRLLVVGAIAVAGTSPLTAAGAAPAERTGGGEYRYTVIADSADGFQPSLDCPALNNKGEVAFRARRRSGEEQVLVGTGGKLTVIADRDDAGVSLIKPDMSINDRGDVAFSAELLPPGTGQVIMRGNGTKLTTLVSTKDDVFAHLAPSAAVGAKGRVYFKGILDEDAGFEYGMFSARKPSKLTTHFLVSEHDFGVDLSPVSVRGKRVAFTAYPDAGGSASYVMKGESLTPIVDSTACGEALNDEGQIAFIARLTDGRDVVVRGDPVT